MNRQDAKEVKGTPLAANLPFNRESLGGEFVPAKRGGQVPEQEGHWLIIQDNALIATPAAPEWCLPFGRMPAEFAGATLPPLLLGAYRGVPCWAAALPREAEVPPGYGREILFPARDGLPEDLLSLAGMARQLLYWEGTSGRCPRCGDRTERLPGEWGKKCVRCAYEHYPHLHPCVIVLVRDGGRVLLTRKREWAPGRYSLVAGFVDNGESLEGAVRREVREEVGVEVDGIRYRGSQNWPFPSQLMVGFTAEYAGGDVRPDTNELEDARWFPLDALPNLPSRLSIARFIIEHYARRD
jgi:NAD+ diphosphatase